MFKLSLVSSSCNYTSSKSLSPLFNGFLDDVLIQHSLFVHNALILVSYTDSQLGPDDGNTARYG